MIISTAIAQPQNTARNRRSLWRGVGAPLAIDSQRWSHSMPGRRSGAPFISTSGQFEFAHLIDVGGFHPWIGNSKPQRLYEVPDSELMSRLSPRTNTDSKFGAIPAYGSVDPQQLTKIGVAPQIEGASVCLRSKRSVVRIHSGVPNF